MNTLPESIHEAVAADDGVLEAIVVKATKLMREKTARKTRTAQVNAVSGPGDRGYISLSDSQAPKIPKI